MMLKTRIRLFLAAALFCGLTAGANAQSSTQGAIGGTVFDATGAVIPKASVVIHRATTNADITVTTDDSGNFKAPLVEPGTYTVTVSAPGFGGYRADSVTVQVGPAD